MKQLLLAFTFVTSALSANADTKNDYLCEYFEIQNMKVHRVLHEHCSVVPSDRAVPVAVKPIKPVVGPLPGPTPDPAVEPEPQPTPDPLVEPEPQPTPDPVVEPEPQPTPDPVPEPEVPQSTDDGNNGHGNDAGGTDPNNPGKGGGTHDDNGHGNDVGGTDSSNPGSSGGTGGGSGGGTGGGKKDKNT